MTVNIVEGAITCQVCYTGYERRVGGWRARGSDVMKTYWTCLEFTKTVGWAERDRPDDELISYEALVGWAERAGVVTAAEAKRLSGRAAMCPEEARCVLEQATALRALIYRIFSAIGEGLPSAPSDIEQLNAFLPAATARRGLVPAMSGIGWRARISRSSVPSGRSSSRQPSY
jgi:predicted RNA-binding Zn ribbon-like protein